MVARTYVALGWVQISTGALILGASILLAILRSCSVMLVIPFVPVVLYIPLGVVTLFEAKYKTKCRAVTYLVFCIISVVVGLGLITVAGEGIHCDDGNQLETNLYEDATKFLVANIFNGFLIVLGVVGVVVYIWCSILARKAISDIRPNVDTENEKMQYSDLK